VQLIEKFLAFLLMIFRDIAMDINSLKKIELKIYRKLWGLP